MYKSSIKFISDEKYGGPIRSDTSKHIIITAETVQHIPLAPSNCWKYYSATFCLCQFVSFCAVHRLFLGEKRGMII